jgi:hypothetical protein
MLHWQLRTYGNLAAVHCCAFLAASAAHSHVALVVLFHRYARMREAGQIDDYGDYVPTSKPRGTRGGDYCYCPECMRMRRVNKDADRQARREQAWRWRMEQ